MRAEQRCGLCSQRRQCLTSHPACDSSIVEHPLSGRGLTSINVGNDANVVSEREATRRTKEEEEEEKEEEEEETEKRGMWMKPGQLEYH